MIGRGSRQKDKKTKFLRTFHFSLTILGLQSKIPLDFLHFFFSTHFLNPYPLHLFLYSLRYIFAAPIIFFSFLIGYIFTYSQLLLSAENTILFFLFLFLFLLLLLLLPFQVTKSIFIVTWCEYFPSIIAHHAPTGFFYHTPYSSKTEHDVYQHWAKRRRSNT